MRGLAALTHVSKAKNKSTQKNKKYEKERKNTHYYFTVWKEYSQLEENTQSLGGNTTDFQPM